MGEAPVCGTGGESNGRQTKRVAMSRRPWPFPEQGRGTRSSGLSRGRGTSILILQSKEEARVIGLGLMKENTPKHREIGGRLWEGRQNRKKQDTHLLTLIAI